MYPGDNEAGKRTVGPFSKTPLIRYPAGSPHFSPGPRAPLTQSQVFSLPLNAASPMLSPPPLNSASPWTSSASIFRDSLPTWIPSPSSSVQPLSLSPPLLFGSSSSVPVEENRDFSIGFYQNPSFPPNDRELILNGESSHGKKPIKQLSCEIMELNAEENGNEMIQTNLGVNRRAENNIDPFPKSHKRNASEDRPYTQEELQKISTCKRLKELASEPQKVRRILANRETAKRSKQRTTQYIIDLENKVASLSNENASLKTKLVILEKRFQALELRTRDSNNEEMQMNNQFDKPNMWNHSNNIEQTNVDFENPNGQLRRRRSSFYKVYDI